MPKPPVQALELADALGHGMADKRVEILRRVGECGSISEAARAGGVSYKAAWQALDTLSNLAGAALVERVVGGSGGGGARLTAAGEQLLRAAAELVRTRDQVLARLAGQGSVVANLAALGLRTSMRNLLPCSVAKIVRRGQAVQVNLQLDGGAMLASSVTRESVQLLGLRQGDPVLALCKATAVHVAAQAVRVPARNVLPGRVVRASRATGGGEVALQLEGGLQLVGFAADGSGLRVGHAAFAGLDESAVVVAVAG